MICWVSKFFEGSFDRGCACSGEAQPKDFHRNDTAALLSVDSFIFGEEFGVAGSYLLRVEEWHCYEDDGSTEVDFTQQSVYLNVS